MDTGMGTQEVKRDGFTGSIHIGAGGAKLLAAKIDQVLPAGIPDHSQKI